MNIPEVARKIARTLLTSGGGKLADRLMLVDKDNRDMGGWCEGAVEDQIVAALRAAVGNARQKGRKR